MCFMMDPQAGKKICYVQFPQRFDGIDRHDRYSNRNVVFFDVCIVIPLGCYQSNILIIMISACLWVFYFITAKSNLLFFCQQINMKGLDGIQGPIYVGTGCVFRRHALYGYDAPKKAKPPGKTCNCLPKWCCFCCGSKKKNKKKKTDESKKKSKSSTALTQIHALENIQEGIEGEKMNVELLSIISLQTRICFRIPD